MLSFLKMPLKKRLDINIGIEEKKKQRTSLIWDIPKKTWNVTGVSTWVILLLHVELLSPSLILKNLLPVVNAHSVEKCHAGAPKQPCYCCGGNHCIYDCPKRKPQSQKTSLCPVDALDKTITRKLWSNCQVGNLRFTCLCKEWLLKGSTFTLVFAAVYKCLPILTPLYAVPQLLSITGHHLHIGGACVPIITGTPPEVSVVENLPQRSFWGWIWWHMMWMTWLQNTQGH